MKNIKPENWQALAVTVSRTLGINVTAAQVAEIRAGNPSTETIRAIDNACREISGRTYSGQERDACQILRETLQNYGMSTGETLTDGKLNAILATSYNLHVGAKRGGEAMTPAKAAKLPWMDRVAIAHLLREKGGSDLYSKADGQAVYAHLMESR